MTNEGIGESDESSATLLKEGIGIRCKVSAIDFYQVSNLGELLTSFVQTYLKASWVEAKATAGMGIVCEGSPEARQNRYTVARPCSAYAPTLPRNCDVET